MARAILLLCDVPEANRTLVVWCGRLGASKSAFCTRGHVLHSHQGSCSPFMFSKVWSGGRRTHSVSALLLACQISSISCQQWKKACSWEKTRTTPMTCRVFYTCTFPAVNSMQPGDHRSLYEFRGLGCVGWGAWAGVCGLGCMGWGGGLGCVGFGAQILMRRFQTNEKPFFVLLFFGMYMKTFINSNPVNGWSMCTQLFLFLCASTKSRVAELPDQQCYYFGTLSKKQRIARIVAMFVRWAGRYFFAAKFGFRMLVWLGIF